MTNTPLAEWIRKEEITGYSETQLRNYLIQRGYSLQEITEAITLLKPKKITTLGIKDFFKPTPLKLIFPILFICMIAFIYFMPIIFQENNLQQILETEDQLGQLRREYPEMIHQDNADPEEVITILKEIEEKESYLNQPDNDKESDKEPFIDVLTSMKLIYNLNPFKEDVIILIPITLAFAILIYLFSCLIAFSINFFLLNHLITRKIIAYSFFVIIIIVLSFLLLNLIVQLGFNKSNLDYPENTKSFKILVCNNTKILNDFEKKSIITIEKYLKEEWRVCSEPYCHQQCYDTYKNTLHKYINLRGNTPSCICIVS